MSFLYLIIKKTAQLDIKLYIYFTESTAPPLNPPHQEYMHHGTWKLNQTCLTCKLLILIVEI